MSGIATNTNTPGEATIINKIRMNTQSPPGHL